MEIFSTVTTPPTKLLVGGFHQCWGFPPPKKRGHVPPMQKENHLPSNLYRGYVSFVEGRFPDWMIGKVPRIFRKKLVFHHVSLVESKGQKEVI